MARLARLTLTDEEEQAYRAQLSQVLDAFEALKGLDAELEGVEPTHHVNLEPTVLREDEPEPALTVDEALLNAPEREGSSFAVPKVIE